MEIIDAVPETPISIGKQGEHLSVCVRFPIGKWRKTFGDGGTFFLNVMRHGDSEAQPVQVSTDDDYVYWFPERADRANPGIGYCELHYVVDGSVVKSHSFLTSVSPSITGIPIDRPEPYESWMDFVLRTVHEIHEEITNVLPELKTAIAKHSEDIETLKNRIDGIDEFLEEEHEYWDRQE